MGTRKVNSKTKQLSLRKLSRNDYVHKEKYRSRALLASGGDARGEKVGRIMNNFLQQFAVS